MFIYREMSIPEADNRFGGKATVVMYSHPGETRYFFR